jgi:uncharacterized protein
MQPMKKPFPQFLLLLAGLASGVPAQADIALWGGSQAALSRVVGLEGTQPLVVGPGQGRVLSGATTWELRGDPAEQPKLVEWSPPHALVRRGTEALRKRPELVAYATISLSSATDAGRGVLSEFWPTAGEGPALLVASWVSAGRATQTRVFELVPGAPLPLAELHFFLREEELGGRPALMLWTSAGFVAPEPRFEDPLAMLAYLACLAGHVDQLAIALHNGMEPTVVDRHGMSLLAHCAEAGAARCIPLLLSRAPALLHLADKGGLTPLQHAARNGREQALQLLLAPPPPAPVPVPAGKSGTPAPAPVAPAPVEPADPVPALNLAAARGHAVSSGLLAESIKTMDTQALVALACAALDRGYPAVAARVLECPAGEQAARDATLAAAFARACARGEAEAVRQLRRLGLVSVCEAAGFALAHSAVVSGDLDTVRGLLDAGAMPDRSGPGGVTPLSAAVAARNVEMVRVLLAAGAKAGRLAADGSSLLHVAVRGDSPELVVLLLRAGARAEVSDASGTTPLVLALREGSKACASALLQGGARMPVAGAEFEPLLEIALRMDLAPAVRSLLDQGWTPDQPLAGGWPVLRVAYFLGATRCEAVLVEAGAGELKDLSNRPRAVRTLGELDTPPRPQRPLQVADPRPQGEVFPRQTVNIDLVVDFDGVARFVRLRNCPDRRVERAVLAALAAMRFEPALLEGKPVAARFSQTLAFASSKDRR